MGAFGTVAYRMNRLAGALGSEALRQLSETAALTVKKTALDQLVRTVGGDRAISGYGRRQRRGRVKGDVGYDYEGAGVSFVKYRPPGYWTLLEEGSYKAGGQWKAPRRRGAPRRQRGTVSTYTRSPVRPRRTLTKATALAEPKVRAAVEEAFHDVVADVLEG
jgi:hypothetical protein